MNTGASAEKSKSVKSENNQNNAQGTNLNPNTQNLNFVEIHSNNQSSRSYEVSNNNEMRRGIYNSNVKNRPMFNHLASPSNENREIASQASEPHGHAVIWGTNINQETVIDGFKQFLLNFRLKDDDNRTENYYIRQLEEVHKSGVLILNIDGRHIYSYDPQMYHSLVYFPSEMIPLMDLATLNLYVEMFSLQENKPQMGIGVRINSLVNQSRIRDLNPNDIDKLISISGITIRNSDIIPEMRGAYFRCVTCHNTEMISLQRSNIVEPTECKNCRSKFTYEIVHNLSYYSDKQHVKLQETPEHMPEGETPLTVHLCCYDELVDTVKPGDKCEVVGILRAQGMRVNPNQRVTKSVYRTYIDVVSFTKQNKKRLDNPDNDNQGNDTSEEYRQYLKDEVYALSQNPNIYEILVDSFAPSIWENEDIKKGLLLQLFGGCSKDFSSSGRGRFRGDLNVLLVGDPSTAKSQLLQYVHNLSSRGIYTSGKGSSVVGLTAYVTKDPETREVVLESGALVLSDRGICCIDEFDKMDDSTRVILHEAMEQQTISIAKAGIICQLNTRTAILAAANPKNSKYDTKLSVVENIQLPPTLLSRFDLIYLMLDRNNDAYDRRLANHIISLYGKFEDLEEVQNKYLPKELIAAYISTAKNLKPKMTEEVTKVLVESYIKMRDQGGSRKTVSATPRQLESIIRLSEARAKLRFSQFVEIDDVEEALRLVKVAIQQAATDPETGLIDMDLLNTGQTSTSRSKLASLMDTIKNILREYADVARKGVKFSSLDEEVKKRVKDMGSQSFTYSEFDIRDALKHLEEDDIIQTLGNKKAPIVRLTGFQYQ